MLGSVAQELAAARRRSSIVLRCIVALHTQRKGGGGLVLHSPKDVHRQNTGEILVCRCRVGAVVDNLSCLVTGTEIRVTRLHSSPPPASSIMQATRI